MKKILTLLLSLLLVFSSGCTNYKAQVENLTKQVESLESEVSKKENTIDNYKKKNEEIQKSTEDKEKQIQEIYQTVAELELQLEESEKAKSQTQPQDQAQNPEQNKVVYVTKSGTKYHNQGCQHLEKSCIEKDLTDAQNQGYTPCSRCW